MSSTMKQPRYLIINLYIGKSKDAHDLNNNHYYFYNFISSIWNFVTKVGRVITVFDKIKECAFNEDNYLFPLSRL